MADRPVQAPKGVRMFSEPTLVRHEEATRFLWGDDESGVVSDAIYGKNARIGSMVFTLRPGGFFTSSTQWKALFDQDRFYYVLRGRLAIRDPETGDIAVAEEGEAIYWRGARWHFGYNLHPGETAVCDWYAPQERPPDVPEVEFGKTKAMLDMSRVRTVRDDLLGHWPAELPAARTGAMAEGRPVTISRSDALHRIRGEQAPIFEHLFVSSPVMTAGTVELPTSVIGEPQREEGDKVLLVKRGQLNVHLPESFDWYELHPRDCLYLPPGTPHQLCNYRGDPVELLFYSVPAPE